MVSLAKPTDPRIAPAVEQLAAVVERAHAVWTRMGIAKVDCERRWHTFLTNALLPFIEDFGALQSSAEYNAATENDVLLREVCYLATRLDEAPRHADVATIVALLKQHYARTPMQSPLLAATAHFSRHRAAGEEAKKSEGSNSENQNNSHRDATRESGDAPPHAAARQRSTKELMFLTLPSFTDLIQATTEPQAGVLIKKETTERLSEPSTEKANWIGSDGDDDVESEDNGVMDLLENEEVTEPIRVSCASPSADAASKALRHLMQANTHEGVRQQLQSELDRLKALADNRLRVLQVLCKQRALLSRSTAEQVVVRAAYRAKYLGDGEESALETLAAAAASSACASASARVAAVVEPSVSPPTSSHFLSLPPSPKSSGDSFLTAAVEGDTLDASDAPLQKKQQPQQHQCGTRGTRSLQDATTAELQLLLCAQSCCLDPSASWDSREPPPPSSSLHARRCSNSGSSQDKNGNVPAAQGSGSTWPSCSPTTGSSNLRITQATTAPPGSTGAFTTTAASRPTVWEVDVSSVTAYGTHQDLTMQRIQREAESIIAAIAASNCRLQVETQEELKALETLEVLWRAMSAQKTSPSVSSHIASGQNVEEEEGSSGDQPPRAQVGDTSTLSTSSAKDPLFTPLKPVPFAESREQVLARYAQLLKAFEADVAARPSATALAAPSVQPTAESGSQPSSLSSSARATGGSASSELPSPAAGTSSHTRGNLYLPPVVRQVLRAPSFAPVFDYVHRTRVAFQKHLSTQQDALVEKIMARLRNVYQVYYAATRDSAYAAAPDGELRVAMEEELLETLQASDVALETEKTSMENEASTYGANTSVGPSDKVLLSFQRHLTACQQVREQAEDEIEYLRLRLHIIEQAEPLVKEYQAILSDKAEMQTNSRERLLSKKVNMAKQLLQEEKVRRRVAKDVPRILAHLTELTAAWEALQAGADPCEDTQDPLEREDAAAERNRTGNTALNAASGCRDLYICGQRVRDLLAGATTASSSSGASTAVSRTRPRSLSARPPPSSSRSVSPAVPATARPRVERSVRQDTATANGRRGTPSPQPVVRHDSSSRHIRTSRSPSFASSTVAASAKYSTNASSAHVHSQPLPNSGSRLSPTPAMGRSQSPVLRHGLALKEVNTSALRNKTASRSPAPVSGGTAAHQVPFSTHFTSR